MRRKVAIYARVSTEHEAQLSALENQVQYYDDILKAHSDWILFDRYIDEGITGTSINKRKNFLRMMDDAEKGCFDLIVTREVSRFARNTVDTLQETRRLKKMGVEVFFTDDNIWTFNDEDGELKLTIMATLAQNESKKTSQRVKAGQMISFKNGVFYGTGNILGYDKIGKDMVVNEEQAEIVKFIYSEFLSGKGSTTIKYELEQRGYKTPTGLSRWSSSYVTRILRNAFYSGTIVYRKSYIPDYLEQKAKINYGEVEKIVVEGKHEPLVTKEDFEKVQKILNEHSVRVKAGKRKSIGVPRTIWSKKLLCQCGSTFNRNVYHKNKGETTYCYVCYRKKNQGSVQVRKKKGLDTSDTCKIKSIPEWKLETMATIFFQNLIQDKERIIELANDLIKNVIKEDSQDKEYKKEIEKYNNKIEEEKIKESKLLNMYLENLIKREEYESYQKKLEKKIEDYKLEIAELEYKIISIEPANVRIDNIKNYIRRVLDFRNNGVVDELIEEFVDKIIVHENYFEWRIKHLNKSINIKINGRQKSDDLNIQIINFD